MKGMRKYWTRLPKTPAKKYNSKKEIFPNLLLRHLQIPNKNHILDKICKNPPWRKIAVING